MASITEIRSRMRSVEQTLKITNAMYLISSAKVKKARKQLSEVEPYFDRLAKTILDIFRHSPDLQHRYIEGHEKPKEERKTGFVVITGDKGLAGAYNHNVLKLAESYLARKKDPTLFLIGQMGRHYFEKSISPLTGSSCIRPRTPRWRGPARLWIRLWGCSSKGRWMTFTWCLPTPIPLCGWSRRSSSFCPGPGHAQRPPGPFRGGPIQGRGAV
mgnify:CR=1 FL=1